MAGFVTPELPGMSDVTFPLAADRAQPPAAETPAPPRRVRRARTPSTGTTTKRTPKAKTRARTTSAAATTPTPGSTPAVPREPAGTTHAVDTLRSTLQMSVPLRMFEMRDWADEALHAKAGAGADAVAHHGDDLMFGGKHCASTFNALTDGLAAAALLVGAVDWLELHFCATDHEQCPRGGPITTRAPGPWARPTQPATEPTPGPTLA
ncbi:hypothetical protein BCF44_12294 [Kutzneria buriramensis]|uniref:Uncharacterized protein n=2 Tax=Kutzneria buriramensis TaxID=1045776 RepID=A0A3E0GWH5_9PSEU|nr:hypothetical protein BCF44_12294 [Kutzneria buriramensis]